MRNFRCVSIQYFLGYSRRPTGKLKLRVRARILCKQLKTKGGGSVIASLVSDTAATHLLIGNNVRPSRLPVVLGMKEVPRGVRVAGIYWALI